MIGDGCMPAVETRSCHASCSSSCVAHATWCTVPAPPTPRSSGGVVVEVEPAARRASRLPFVGAGRRESQRLLQECPARIRFGGEGVHGVEPLQCVLGRYLRMLGEQGRVIDCGHDEAVSETLRVVERDPVVVAGEVLGPGSEPALPEVERVVRGDPPLNRMHHSRACTATPRAGVLEEGDVAARAPLLVGVEEVVDGRVVLIDRLLHEPEAEDAGVELHVPRRVARDARDVMDAVEPQPPEPNRTGLS